VLSLLECLRHLSAPDCHGATLLLQSMGSKQQQQQQQQQRASPRPVGSGLLTALLGLLHERHIAALQVCRGLNMSANGVTKRAACFTWRIAASSRWNSAVSICWNLKDEICFSTAASGHGPAHSRCMSAVRATFACTHFCFWSQHAVTFLLGSMQMQPPGFLMSLYKHTLGSLGKTFFPHCVCCVCCVSCRCGLPSMAGGVRASGAW
jgi:hypothetical protein